MYVSHLNICNTYYAYPTALSLAIQSVKQFLFSLGFHFIGYLNDTWKMK